MRYLFFILLLLSANAFGQAPDATPASATQVAHPRKTVGGQGTVGVKWSVSVKPAFVKHHGPDLAPVKEAKRAQKIVAQTKEVRSPMDDAKTTASAPVVASTFAANPSVVGTPADNSVAISNGGRVVSVNNDGIYFSSATGSGATFDYWSDYLDISPSTLIYDPRVIYDPVADRFIVVVLVGASSTESTVAVLFSNSNNPAADGFDPYGLPGNILNNGTWFDYPNIGISGQDLFITGNLFTDAGSFNQSIVFQVRKAEGYSGTPINYVYYSGLSNSPYSAFSLVPATHAFGSSTDAGIYLLSNNSSGGASVRLWRINNNLGSSPGISSTTVSVPAYSAPADALQPSGDDLSTGGCRVQEAFFLDGILHAVFNTDVGSGYSGVYYARVNVGTNTAAAATYGEAGADIAYPCLASASRLLQIPPSKSVIIGFCRSSTSEFPSIGAVNCDNAMVFSSSVTVQSGDALVDYTSGPGPERWGDYTHLQRRFNASPARVWLSASYGTNIAFSGGTISQKYRTCIAELAATDTAGSAAGLKEEVATQQAAQVYPNPLAGPALLRIKFKNPTAGAVHINLHDASGRLVRSLHRGHLRAGEHLLAFSEDALQSGTYFVTIAAGEQILHREKLLVAH